MKKVAIIAILWGTLGGTEVLAGYTSFFSNEVSRDNLTLLFGLLLWMMVDGIQSIHAALDKLPHKREKPD